MIDKNTFEHKTAAYYTLGCKLNFAETSAIGKILHEQGIRKVRSGESADICIINTCSVTELADKKCRQAIRKIHKQHPKAYVIVTGCYAQLKPEEVSQIDGVDLVLGSGEKLDVLTYLDKLNTNDSSSIFVTRPKDILHFSPSCSSDDRTRHFLKIQDGCDYYCTYCTIPYARGRSRNGSIESLVKQARQVASEGGKEIVLTGVNIGDFGKTTNETFIDLIKALDEVDGIERYRISSIEPNLITHEVIDFVAESKRFAPHFHIPLQSGSDDVLKLMKRKYDTELFRDRIAYIKEVIPHAFIGVDVIVGTRGETDAFFDDAFRFIESLDITQLHVFSYSERPGTKALEIDHSVDSQAKHERSKRLLDLSDSKLRAFYENHIGETASVLFEHTKRGNFMHGFTENYIKTEIAYTPSLINNVSTVVLRKWNDDHTALVAELI